MSSNTDILNNEDDFDIDAFEASKEDFIEVKELHLGSKEDEALIEEYKDLYEHIQLGGIEKGRALEMLRGLYKKEDRYMADAAKVRVQLQFDRKELNEKFNFDSLDQQDKVDVLWKQGLDAQTGKFFSANRRVRLQTPKGFQLVFRDVIWGGERLDDDWVKSTYVDDDSNLIYRASDEARDYAWNAEKGASISQQHL